MDKPGRTMMTSTRIAHVAAASRAIAMIAGLATALATTPATADPIVLEAGKSVELTCTTKSMVVADNQFKATRGTFKIRLELKDQTAEPPSGQWWLIETTPEHLASLSLAHKDACKDGCPLVARPGSKPELWAPRRAAPDAMTGDEPLSVAALDANKLTLRATTFRAKELHALEEGECKLSP